MPDTPFNIDINASKIETAPAIRAYLGGSFNPVHNSHIQMAMIVYDCLSPIAAQQQRPLQVSLLPNARSPFKQQSMDPAHRLAMLKLAVQNTPLQISELELWQMPPVYSIDSVRALRQRYPNDSLIFIMGMDSARSLEKWKNGLQLTDYVHLWIFSRSDNSDSLDGINSSDTAQREPVENRRNNNKNLSTAGISTLCDELPTKLQAQVADRLSNLTQPFSHTLNPPFKDSKPLKNKAQGRIYIDPRQVATVSSTDIRKQLRQQLSTTDYITNNKPHNLTHLLNPTVYQYIIAHQLYSAV